jgi:hypothetical protein
VSGSKRQGRETSKTCDKTVVSSACSLRWIRDCWRGCGVASRRESFLLDIAVPFTVLYPFPASTVAGDMFAIVR